MLDKKDFEEIGKNLKNFEENREITIQKSRRIIQLSKQIIYAVHRDDLKAAEQLITEIQKEIKELPENCHNIDMHKIAIQEYVEAICYLEFVKNDKLPTRKELDVNTESYLLGLCDLTGELVRKAVADVIKKNFKEVKKIKDLVEGIYGEFLKFNLRNSELRKKSGSIKWNLTKLEDIEYSLSMRK
ncbi:MAG: hypothetical protein ISS48_03525 [Candidatus Aenigmarchaeota archaeon]|nr:hypothetical protein [Candidatus Aenigmarchaeota archaeon]